jgi:histone H3/H4
MGITKITEIENSEVVDITETPTESPTENSTTEKTSKKHRKKCKFFDIYINRILRTVYEKYSINTNAKEQVNNILKIVCKNIVNDSVKIMRNSDRKTLSVNNVSKALRKYISRISNVENNLMLIWNIGFQAVDKFKENQTEKKEKGVNVNTPSKNPNGNLNEKPERKTEVINTVIPPHLTEKYLRAFNGVLVSKGTIIFFAACIDYIAKQILDKAVQVVEHCQANRISIKHLEIAIKSDIPLSIFFERMGITLLGTPRINKISEKSSKTAIARYKPSLCICKSNFERMVRNIIFETCGENRKISKIVIILLQYYMEQEITELLFRSNVITKQYGRVKVMGKAILLAKYLGSGMVNISADRYTHFMEKYNVGNSIEENDDDLGDNIDTEDSEFIPSESFSFATDSEDGTELDSE